MVGSQRSDREEPVPRITLAVVGDVMLGRLMNRVIAEMGPLYPWGNTLPHLRSADLTLANLECAIAGDGRPWTRTPKVFHFRADPAAIQVLQAAGVDVVSLANNHVLDYEEEGLLETLDHLDRAGIAHAGAGRNLEEAMRPAFLEARGIRVGVVAFTDNEPDWLAGPGRPGTNYVEIGVEGPSFARVRSAVAAAHEGGADLVIFSCHWGPNMVPRPSPRFRQFAHAVMDLGVDIFHGHSAHIFQGIEIYKGRPILYDTGDFVDDYAVDPVLRNDQSLLYQLTATLRGIEKLESFPVLISNFQVNLATGGDLDQIAQRLQSLCAEMGTEVRRDDDRLEIRLEPPAGGG